MHSVTSNNLNWKKELRTKNVFASFANIVHKILLLALKKYLQCNILLTWFPRSIQSGASLYFGASTTYENPTISIQISTTIYTIERAVQILRVTESWLVMHKIIPTQGVNRRPTLQIINHFSANSRTIEASLKKTSDISNPFSMSTEQICTWPWRRKRKHART